MCYLLRILTFTGLPLTENFAVSASAKPLTVYPQCRLIISVTEGISNPIQNQTTDTQMSESLLGSVKSREVFLVKVIQKSRLTLKKCNELQFLQFEMRHNIPDSTHKERRGS